MKRGRRALTGSLVALGLLLPLHRSASAQTVTPVPALDLNRYMGKWYELAVYPGIKPEKNCNSNAVALFAIGYKRNRFLVVTSCQAKEGITESRTASGKRDKAGDGRLKLTYTWPFSSKEWVLALAPDYSWALVGSPNRKLLRIYSRTPTPQPEVLADIRARAAAQGFDPAKLITMPQQRRDDPAPTPTPAAAPANP